MLSCKWADKGQLSEIEASQTARSGVLAGVSRLGNMRLRASCFSVWLVVRGTAEVLAKEGKFLLRAGDWIAFEGDSHPEWQARRHGLVIGMVLSPALSSGNEYVCAFVGKGRMAKAEATFMFRLWRQAMHARTSATNIVETRRALKPLTQQWSSTFMSTFESLAGSNSRLPQRQRRALNRVQRARLYLEGNAHRVVRLSELADISRYSTWYLSKAFHEIYGESTRSVALRLRMERACDLLRFRTTLSIGDVAEQCGFDNACSFARAFRERMGMTATMYRESEMLAGGGRTRAPALDLSGVASRSARSVKLRLAS